MMVEVIGSIAVGLTAGSFALLAFGGDSLIELISGIAVLEFLRKNKSELESKRTEQITSMLLFALIPVIGFGAVYSYFTGCESGRVTDWNRDCDWSGYHNALSLV